MDYRRVGASALGANGGPGLLRPWGDPPPDPVALLGTETGLHWEDELGHWCLLTHVVSGLPRAGRGEQTRAVLKKLDGDLEWVKLGFGDVLRTWFFLDDILAWYAEFNQVRTRFLADRGPLDRPPASTAVGYAAGAGEPAAAGATADSDANASGRPRPSSHRDLALAATAI